MSRGNEHGERLCHAVDALFEARPQSSRRLDALADYCVDGFRRHGLDGVKGGTMGETRVKGFGRTKKWDVVFEHVGKPRLAVSLKSILRTMRGTVPNRIDDLIGEAASVQQRFPEIAIGYVAVLDVAADFPRGVDKLEGDTWVKYFMRRVRALSLTRAPVWGAGLIEASWFVLVDSRAAPGNRVKDLAHTVERGEEFFRELVSLVRQREPSIP